MYWSYLVGFFLLELTQLAFLKITNEGSVLAITLSDDSKEPSCEELRKMWRHTKREMQQKSDTPATSRYRAHYHEPFSYGWKTQARPRNAMYSKPVYGRVVHSPDKFIYRNNVPSRLRSYDQVARMVGSSSAYYPNLQKPTYFRLDYPVRRPVLPMRISHIGRFQELQNVLRDERANELQAMKLKDTNQQQRMDVPVVNSDYSSNDNTNSKYSKYPISQSSDEDATATDVSERKLRGTDGGDTEDTNEDEGVYAEKLESEIKNENENSQSTSKPGRDVLTDDGIPRRWALGEWK